MQTLKKADKQTVRQAENMCCAKLFMFSDPKTKEKIWLGHP
jgi:hypothetical protein